MIKQRKTWLCLGRSILEWASDTPQKNLWGNLKSVPKLRIYVSDDEEKLEQDIKSLKVNKLYLDITVDTFIHN